MWCPGANSSMSLKIFAIRISLQKVRNKKPKLAKDASDRQGTAPTAFSSDCRGRAKTSRQEFMELERLGQVMGKLLPQILYFLETGFVAAKKIIHLQMSELYSIVRGKSGKSVEFGLKWGINQISGFAMGFLMSSGNASDKKFCIKSVEGRCEINLVNGDL